MAGEGLPYYPNFKATFGTSLAVVTSLLASVSTAVVVVLAADTAAQRGLGFLGWTSDQIGTATGSAAAFLFVAATLSAVYAQAANYEDLPQAVIDEWFADRTDMAARIADWKGRRQRAYTCTRVCWILGVSMLLVTLGVLVYSKLPGELPLAGVAATAVALLNILDPDLRSTWPVALCLSAAGACGVITAAAVQAAWF